MQRRDFLRSAACAVGTTALAGPAFSAGALDVPSLGAAGARKGLEVGAAVRHSQLRRPAYVDLITHHFTQITPEGPFMPDVVAEGRRGLSTLLARKVLDFGVQQNLSLTSHTLFWYQKPLPWLAFEADTNPARAKELYLEFIAKLVPQFSEMNDWIVANELIANSGALRNLDDVGQVDVGFVASLLETTRAHAPNAKLMINDYQLDCASNVCTQRQSGILKLAEALLKRGAPLDVIGTQGHLNDPYKPAHTGSRRFIDAVGDLGLDVYLTELDVNDWNFPKGVAARDSLVASMYYDHLSAVLESRALKRVTFWGIDDQNSWISKGWSDKKIAGTDPRPLLFDNALEPKPAFFAALKAIEGAPNRFDMMTVREAQEALTKLGFDPGIIDGQWGRKSLAALNGFLSGAGLAEATSLDIPSQKALLAAIGG